MGLKVEFDYDINDKVITIHGDKGIITSMTIDNCGEKQYFVETSQSARWMLAIHIEPDENKNIQKL